MKKINIKKILHNLILIIIVVLFLANYYIKTRMSITNFEQIVFVLKSNLSNSDNTAFFIAIRDCLPFLILFYIILYILFYGLKLKKDDKLHFNYFQKHKKIWTSVLLIISLTLMLNRITFFDYIYCSLSKSNFIQKNYIDPKKAEIEFKEKRNLILIFVESLETTTFTKKHGGYWDYEITPELYKLLNEEDSISFYNKNIGQGMNMIQGSSWTTASIVAHTTGLPLKARVNLTDYLNDNFMNGAYGLGDLLKDNGYHNEVISGARLDFGSLNNYFTVHGKFDIIDSELLDNYGYKMKKEDKGNWGLNDNYLFTLAKDRIKKLSKDKEPFNLELITIDTHFLDGFVGNYSETKFKEQYENAYATTSKLIYDFVNWVKNEPIYQNTTIVIVGDHLSMQTDFFAKRKAEDSKRYVYNCIINAPKNNAKSKNRIVTALDMYPTIVYSIGGEIKGDQLGLGINLFSNKKTLAEKYTLKKLDKELKKKSLFYNNEILKK